MSNDKTVFRKLYENHNKDGSIREDYRILNEGLRMTKVKIDASDIVDKTVFISCEHDPDEFDTIEFNGVVFKKRI